MISTISTVLLIGAGGSPADLAEGSGALGSGELAAGRTGAGSPDCAAATFWHSAQRFADLDRRHAFLMSSSVVFTHPG